MSNKHLTYFKTENFKKFTSLEVKNIGLINLIVGDNNVGKTCFLESLLFNNNFIVWINNLHVTLDIRGINFDATNVFHENAEFPANSYFEYLVRDIKKPLSVSYVTREGDEEQLSILYSKLNDLTKQDFKKRKDKLTYNNLEHWLKFFKNSKFDELQFLYQDNFIILDSYWPFITFNISYNSDIERFLKIMDQKRDEDIQKLNELSYNHKQELINTLNGIFDLKIVDYITKNHGDNSILSIATEENENYTPITLLGDGFNKIFRYIVEIIFVKQKGEGRIMIDEIDTGIHYSKLKHFWFNIIKICKDLDVQLFATTHSKDCIDAIIEASKEIGDLKNEIRLIKLLESKNRDIKAITYPYNEFEYLVESETETR